MYLKIKIVTYFITKSGGFVRKGRGGDEIEIIWKYNKMCSVCNGGRGGVK